MAQDGTPSEGGRACDRCRERRVKCDKRQPTCLRCEKLGKPCPGYDKKRKFVDEGVILRKKYQASSSREEGGQDVSIVRSLITTEQAAASGTSSRPTQFNTSTIAFSSPRTTNNRTTSHERSVSNQIDSTSGTTESGAVPDTDVTLPLDTTHAILYPDTTQQASATEDEEFFYNIFNDPDFDPAWFDIDPGDTYATGATSCGFLPNIPNIIDEVDRGDIMQSIEGDVPTTPGLGLGFYSDNVLWAAETQLSTSAIITDEREHEMAYLIRHFTEAIGPWMDLFDQDKHFGDLVPLKALRDALLRNAIAAVSAKQLGRARSTKPYIGIQSQKPATMEVIEEVDWFYKAANYYDKAIAFSRIYLQAISEGLSNPPTPNTQLTLTSANSDDLLVAVSIFSLYEALDNFEIGWLQHLSGLKTLLNAISSDQSKELQIVPSITAGRRASFWNFARADYQASYLNHQYTFLNTEDLQLWYSCGLQIQDDGSLYQNTDEVKNDPLHSRQVAELVAHTLLWLLLRVMNYIASVSDTTVTAEMRQARWRNLHGQLEEWHTNLPPTFQPCAQIRYPLQHKTSTISHHHHLTEVFFSMNVCAAALQLYHFARILLLLNKPDEASFVGSGRRIVSRYHLYPEISNEAIKHAHQIIGIALGRPHPAVRVEMLLSLYVAGSCLTADEERKVVLELLQAIEKDTGCSTESRCKDLMREWRWEDVDVLML